MDENNNLENLNTNNNGNVPPAEPNNPYYNPYFQNDDVNNMAENNMNVQENKGVNQVLENQVMQESEPVENDDSLNLFGLDNVEPVESNVVTNQILSNNNIQEQNNINPEQNVENNMNYWPETQENMNYQAPMQNGFDTNMNYENQMQGNMNYQEPMQNGFDANMNYGQPVQNNMNYQEPMNQNTDNYQSPYDTKKKGNKVIPIVLGIVIAVVVLVVIAIIAMPNLFAKKPQPTQNANDIINPTTSYEFYNFYKDFGFDYNSAVWELDETDNSLKHVDYKLTYAQSLEGLASAGFDINTANGRSNLFTFLYNQFSSQADATTAVEMGINNFTLKNESYYAYIDLVGASSMERCYFILLPEEDMFIEFILSNQGTIIPDDINEEVLEYVCGIYKLEDEDEILNGNTIGNQISNEIENAVTNEVETNTVANDVTVNDTVTNDIIANETSSGNEITNRNTTTNEATSTGTSGGIILTPSNR